MSTLIEARSRMKPDQCQLIAIVFSIMYLEAFICNCAAVNLGDRKAKEFLKDKKTFLQKWETIPKKTSGKEIKSDSPAMRSLRKLIKCRNSFIHFKSQDFPRSTSHLKEIENNSQRQIADEAKNARNAISLLINELYNIHPNDITVYVAKQRIDEQKSLY